MLLQISSYFLACYWCTSHVVPRACSDWFFVEMERVRVRHQDTCKTRTKQMHMQAYLLTPWCRVLLQKLTGLQLVKKFPAFHGTRRFITALTNVSHLSLSWASPIQSIYTHPTSWRSILILSVHLRLGLPSDLLPSGFPTKTLYAHASISTLFTHIIIYSYEAYCLDGI